MLEIAVSKIGNEHRDIPMFVKFGLRNGVYLFEFEKIKRASFDSNMPVKMLDVTVKKFGRRFLASMLPQSFKEALL